MVGVVMSVVVVGTFKDSGSSLGGNSKLWYVKSVV